MIENLIIEGTNESPSIVFQTDGILKIEGKIITENAVLTFEPLFTWINKFNGNNIKLDINLEYMNTSASMQLYAFIDELENTDSIQSVNINWYYDEDDEEHLDTGQLFAERLDKVKFNYIMLTSF